MTSVGEHNDPEAPQTPPSAPPGVGQGSSGRDAPESPDAASAPDLEREDVLCSACGYNLRRLEPDGRCPECGMPVERSLHGDALLYSSPEFLRRLRLGLQLIYWGVIARAAVMALSWAWWVVLVIFTFQSGGLELSDWVYHAFVILSILVSVAIGVAIAIGWWLLSTPDPAIPEKDRRNRMRWWVRTLAVFLGVASIVNDVLGQTDAPVTVGPGGSNVAAPMLVLAGAAALALVVAWIAFYFLSMQYLSWIASRVPNESLVRFALRMRWLGPVVFVVGAACFMLGPLAALIFYIVLIHRLMREIQAVEQRQEDELAPAPASPAAG